MLEELRKLAPTLPVVLMSGFNAAELAPQQSGVLRLQKPMTFTELQLAARTLLERSTAQ